MLSILYYVSKNRLVIQDYTNSLFNRNDKLSRLIELNRNSHLSILWPPILFVSMIASFLLVWFFNKRKVDDIQILFDYLIVNLLIFIPLFFTITWFQAHWLRERDDIIEKELLRVREEMIR